MKPDEVVEFLNSEWGLTTTRRTVLTYEKQGLIPPPFLETGKMKEYPNNVVAEFIASWFLIHGDYGLKPQKAVEIRKKSLQMIYDYSNIWREELVGQDDMNSLFDLVKGVYFEKVADFFVFRWIMVRQYILDTPDLDIKSEFVENIKAGKFDFIPRLKVRIEYFVDEDNAYHESLDSEKLDDKKNIKGNIFIIFKHFDKAGFITYVHPEDFVLRNPVIK